MLEKGHIPQKVYNALGFPKDEISGVVYDCNDGIKRECMQQEKLLPHWFQQYLRLSR